MLAVRLPDWPVVAYGIPAQVPAAVFVGNRVVAASQAARHEDITLGMRRRSAQARCPELKVLDRDETLESRMFEPIAATLDDFTPRVEVLRPGRCGFPAKGPARYFGSEKSLAEQVWESIRTFLAEMQGVEGRMVPLSAVRIGIADGAFAADRAARAAVDGPLIVSHGATPTFLSTLPVEVLGRPVLSDLLMRLGIRVLGDFAALDPADVAGRFGADGLVAWQLAWGDDQRVPRNTEPPTDLSCHLDIDPPAERVETAAFLIAGLADRFAEGLTAHGVVCTRLVIGAETEHGERIERVWAHDLTSVAPLNSTNIAQRLRWQMEGWLGATGEGSRGSRAHRVPVRHRLAGGIVRLHLIPEAVQPAIGTQLGLWDTATDRTADVARRLARVQGILGPEAVCLPRFVGARHPGEEWELVPVDVVQAGGPPEGNPEAPWPGRLPQPSPGLVFGDDGRRLQLIDATGRAVRVSGRGVVSAPPATIVIGGVATAVRQWAGPWPSEDRWWDPFLGRRRARMQVIDTEGVSRLCTIENGEWTEEALWD